MSIRRASLTLPCVKHGIWRWNLAEVRPIAGRDDGFDANSRAPGLAAACTLRRMRRSRRRPSRGECASAGSRRRRRLRRRRREEVAADNLATLPSDAGTLEHGCCAGDDDGKVEEDASLRRCLGENARRRRPWPPPTSTSFATPEIERRGNRTDLHRRARGHRFAEELGERCVSMGILRSWSSPGPSRTPAPRCGRSGAHRPSERHRLFRHQHRHRAQTSGVLLSVSESSNTQRSGCWYFICVLTHVRIAVLVMLDDDGPTPIPDGARDQLASLLLRAH